MYFTRRRATSLATAVSAVVLALLILLWARSATYCDSLSHLRFRDDSYSETVLTVVTSCRGRVALRVVTSREVEPPLPFDAARARTKWSRAAVKSDRLGDYDLAMRFNELTNAPANPSGFMLDVGERRSQALNRRIPIHREANGMIRSSRQAFVTTQDRHWHLVIPTWLPVALASIMPGLSVLRAARRRGRVRRGQCPSCGYDLRGSPGGGPCPECGAPRGVLFTKRIPPIRSQDSI